MIDPIANCPDCEAWARRALAAESRARGWIRAMREPRQSGELAVKREVYLRDRGICAYCRTTLSPRQATIDHLVPRSRGGPTIAANLTLSCEACNHRRNSTPLSVWLFCRARRIPGTDELMRRYLNVLNKLLGQKPVLLLPAQQLSGASFNVHQLKMRGKSQ